MLYRDAGAGLDAARPVDLEEAPVMGPGAGNKGPQGIEGWARIDVFECLARRAGASNTDVVRHRWFYVESAECRFLLKQWLV